MGNGLLTFLWDIGNMRKFFTDEHVAVFKYLDELIAKAKVFQADDDHRQAVACDYADMQIHEADRK